MSKIDDLHETYCVAVRAYMNGNGGALIWDAERAGVVAVVTALREVICDNVYMTQECCGHAVVTRRNEGPECCGNPHHSITRDDLINSFNEILGDADNEKAAGGTPAYSRETGYQTRPVAPTPAAPTTARFIDAMQKWAQEDPAGFDDTLSPEMCEWTQGKDGWLVTACRAQYGLSPFYYKPKGCCEFCGKPVRFKENKT